MFIVLSNQASFWGISNEYPELFLNAIHKGPIEIIEEQYKPEVIQIVNRSIETGKLLAAGTLEEAEALLKSSEVFNKKNHKKPKVTNLSDIYYKQIEFIPEEYVVAKGE